MLSKELEQVLNEAFRTARARRHEFITVEHLLLALLDDSASLTVLQACTVDIDALRGDLIEFIDSTTPLLGEEEDGRDTQPTLGFQRVLQRAVFHVQSSGKREVTGANLLVAIFSEQESQAVYFLKSQDVSRLDVVNFITHGIAKDDDDDDVEMPGQSAVDPDEEAEAAESPLDTYATNLNEEAEEGHIDPLIGRIAEVERVAQILARRRKNNPLLVGESGVGKTAIAEGLAKMIVDGNVPETLKDAVVYSLDLGALLAGTKYRGDFEKRFKGLLANLKERDHAILFIDEIHTIIGAGATSGGAMDASNLLKPALQSGKLRCMGSTTYKEYRQHFEKDRALSRRFLKIDVSEPTPEDAVLILQGLKSYFEDFHKVTYSTDAVDAAVQLSVRHITDRKLPDKAIDIIDEAGARTKLVPEADRKTEIGVKEIEAVVSKIARIPPKSISRDDEKALKSLSQDLKRMVFGQDSAIEQVAAAVKLARAGLREPNKPIGSYLFAGPTGVGKTEVARQLAMTQGLELLRFDMSEYMERHTVSRLIGAPPGYVGYDQGGLLTDAVNQNPHCVLLLDEIEKAHPDIYNILLQVMDNGFLTDSNGRKVDFRNVIIIMTTNAGAADAAKSEIGFGRGMKDDEQEAAIKRRFTPEFRNRLDATVMFAPLSKEHIGRVVDKFIIQLEAQLADRKIEFEVTKGANQWIADKGYDKRYGARPLGRTIQEYVKKPLADEILFGKLKYGGLVKVGIDRKKENLTFKFVPTPKPKAPEDDTSEASPKEDA